MGFGILIKHFWGPFLAGFYCREGISCCSSNILENSCLCRFLGEKDNLRYKVPATKEREIIRRNIKSDGNNLFRVPSKTEADQYYTVDMSIVVSECAASFVGSPCTHQYLIFCRITVYTSLSYMGLEAWQIQ